MHLCTCSIHAQMIHRRRGERKTFEDLGYPLHASHHIREDLRMRAVCAWCSCMQSSAWLERWREAPHLTVKMVKGTEVFTVKVSSHWTRVTMGEEMPSLLLSHCGLHFVQDGAHSLVFIKKVMYVGSLFSSYDDLL